MGWVLKSHEPLLLADCRPSALTEDASGFEHEPFVRACAPRSLMYVPIASRGHVLGVLTFAMSESDRRFGADQLASATDLGNRIALAIENARLYDDATGAVKAREEVLSFVSHDLKNPLMAILLTTEMLLESAPDNERRRGWKQLDRIRRGVVQMRHMVEDLLDISSIDAGRLSMEIGEYPVQVGPRGCAGAASAGRQGKGDHAADAGQLQRHPACAATATASSRCCTTWSATR